ncbi:MAG TPA: hypothetical protein VL727_06340, partial [Puia sp.]|nr:hypothetical protein [Puia sp.]
GLSLLLPFVLSAQTDWPRVITDAEGSTIRVYQPQPDSLEGNILKFRAAFSLTKKGGTEAQYGSIVAINVIETDRNNRTLSLLASNVLSLRYSGMLETDKIYQLKETIECGLPGIGADISLDQLVAFMDGPLEARGRSDIGQDPSSRLNNNPPRIIYADRPSMLLLIDGFPRFKNNRDWGLRVVANSPYTIVESSDGWFYLYGGHHWYLGPMPEGPYQHTTYFASELVWMRQDIDFINAHGDEHSDTLREGNAGIRDIVVSTGPAELIQIKGKPVYGTIVGTSLRYVTNTDNDIFLDTSSNRYYVLLSGRWFSSRQLTGQWLNIPSDSLPSGFMEIPEGSPEDRVLSCVAGTAAAREALVDAQIPQTARVSRAAVVQVNFDGPPKFEAIRGTHLRYAINALIPVFYTGTKFYCIDRAVWFVADKVNGPWHVSTDRPEEVRLIPADCPVYNCKYVYVYGETSEYITTGYTAGYLGACVEGSSLVYGTGYYYPSWTDHISCPRPWTYGFNMWLNPWLGWTLGYDFSLDWFNTGVAWDEGYWNNGWWGPADYRPPYIWHHFSGHGLYEKDIQRIAGSNYNNNLYTLRPDVYARVHPDEVYADRQGNVYRHEASGSWSRRQGETWQAVDASSKTELVSLNQLTMCRERGNMRMRNFRQAKAIAGSAGDYVQNASKLFPYVTTKR